MNSQRKLQLNRDKKRICGVCAGVADYFDVDTFIVRIVCVIAAITWPPTIIVYFVMYFLLNDRSDSVTEIKDSVSNSKMYRHFKSVDYRKRLYKDTSNSKISGVCGGIANYFEINPFWVRAGAVGSLFFGPFAIPAYIVAAFVMDDDPNATYVSPRKRRHEERRRRREAKYGFSTSDAEYATSQTRYTKRDLNDCDRTFSDLESKLQRLEATITSKKFKLHNEFKNI